MIRPLIFALVALAGLMGAAGPARAQSEPICGTEEVLVARMPWPSASLLAEIHAQILTETFGCQSRTVPGDLAPTASSMATTGQPAVAPELWITRIAEIWNGALDTGAIKAGARSYATDAFEGWFIPGYTADANPALTGAAGLAANLGALSVAGARPRFVSCPPSWACALINRNLLRAYGLLDRVELLEPATRLELDAAIAQAVNRRQPILFYYWMPNAVLSQLGLKALDMGAYDATAFACLAAIACETPSPSAFPPESVIIAIADWLFQQSPRVAGYLQRASMPIGEMNALLAALTAPGASVESVARNFVETRRDVWRAWIN